MDFLKNTPGEWGGEALKQTEVFLYDSRVLSGNLSHCRT